jgi:hypothetical protein
MLQSYTSTCQQNSILEEILGEKKPARKWYAKYKCLFWWYVKKIKYNVLYYMLSEVFCYTFFIMK